MNEERVLCVDDTQLVLNALDRLLRGQYAVSCASGGEAGLEILREQPDISIILADYTMPGMDGLTFLTEVRNIAPDSVRVLMTAWAEMGTVGRAIDDGLILRCLVKPFGADEVGRVLAEACEHLRGRTPPCG